eukprot:jgi/Ulvmu1/3290/UM153_0002.1
MEQYEFRIFPPARPYSPPEGAAVFVSLKSDKNTGLGTIASKQVANVKSGDLVVDDGAEGDGAAENPDPCHVEADVLTGPARQVDSSTRLPPGLSLEGRVLIQYAVGGSAFVRPARFTPVYTGSPSVILCSDTKSFRKLCRTQVRQGDSVIDIGASYGASTQARTLPQSPSPPQKKPFNSSVLNTSVDALICTSLLSWSRNWIGSAALVVWFASACASQLWCCLGQQFQSRCHVQVIFEQCGNVLGVDVSKEAVAEARRRYPDPSFERLDVLAEPQQLQVVLQTQRPCKAFVDIGGNRELPALVALLPALHQAGVGQVYVKSQALVKSSLRHLHSLEGSTPSGAPAVASSTAHEACAANPDNGASARECQHGPSMRVADACEPGVVLTDAAGMLTPCVEVEADDVGSGAGTAGDAEHGTQGTGTASAQMHVDAAAAAACAAEEAQHITAQPGPAQHKRRRKGSTAQQRTPARVLWRWCNQNMPSAWDLDLQLPEDSGAADERGGRVREGLAIVRDSGRWWSQLVRRATPKKYPLAYPVRRTPTGAAICRYHNYASCHRHAAAACPLDHDHCHACGLPGHTAAACCALPPAGEPA